MSFKTFDLREAIDEFISQNYSETELLDAIQETELAIVENWAYDNGAISSEQELSDIFDDSDIPQMVIDEYGADDIPAMSEAFNNWTDMLCKDGELHETQYHEYCNVGRYSND